MRGLDAVCRVWSNQCLVVLDPALGWAFPAISCTRPGIRADAGHNPRKWNLIGYSAENPSYLEDAGFTDSTRVAYSRKNATAKQNTRDSSYLVKSQTNVTLNSGWNLIALTMDSNVSGDKNISLVAGWNLIGYSSNQTSLSLADAKFNNGSNSYTWANAVANNKLQAYLTYYDSSPALASGRKYKYVATSDLEMDDTALRQGKGYWVYANQSGNLTLTSAWGSASGESYSYSKLRFSNSSGYEAGIGDVGSAGLGLNWIETTLQYSNTGNGLFKYISDQPEDINYILSWQGVFVKSLQDNITLIRQN